MADAYRIVQKTKKGGWIQAGKIRNDKKMIERDLAYLEDNNSFFKMGIQYKVQEVNYGRWKDA